MRAADQDDTTKGRNTSPKSAPEPTDEVRQRVANLMENEWQQGFETCAEGTGIRSTYNEREIMAIIQAETTAAEVRTARHIKDICPVTDGASAERLQSD